MHERITKRLTDTDDVVGDFLSIFHASTECFSRRLFNLVIYYKNGGKFDGSSEQSFQ